VAKRKIIRLVCRPMDWEKDRTDKGSMCAKEIRKAIESMSPFKLKPIGVLVEEGFDPNVNVPSEDLDYEVLYEGKRIAVIDPTCSNYTFEESMIMPVNYYKGEIIKRLDVPAFMVYSMEKEKRPLADRCMWIHGKDVIKCKPEWRYLGGKDQHNYMTNKPDWHRGLQSLIKELLKIRIIFGA